MNKLKLKPGFLAILCLILPPAFSANSRAQCPGFEYCELVWADEFVGTEIDTWSKWD
jgi:hypothetical protein